MKSYTDLEQSRKLAEILPIESADMNYHKEFVTTNLFGVPMYEYKVDLRQPNRIIDWTDKCIPCWSLTALLGVLPFHLIVNNQRYVFSMHKGLNKDGETYMFRYNVFNTDVCLYTTDYYNNPVDACYEMILKLHELKML